LTDAAQHLGIASISHGFDGGPTAGTYHSIYDSYDNFRRFIDPASCMGRRKRRTWLYRLCGRADAGR
jgi:N-acetylated-alpha-linked acidic dipeptidase